MTATAVACVCALGVGCSIPVAEPLAGRGTIGASSVAMDASHSEHLELVLVSGTPTSLADGTVIDVKNISYAHAPGGRNLSLATLILRREGRTLELTLGREHGGAADARSEDGLGWQFVLVAADPYHTPASASVIARKP